MDLQQFCKALPKIVSKQKYTYRGYDLSIARDSRR